MLNLFLNGQINSELFAYMQLKGCYSTTKLHKYQRSDELQ